MAETSPSTETPFPDLTSDAGRLFAQLVAREIPGVPVETDLETLAADCDLTPVAASAALERLTRSGLVGVEGGTPGQESPGGGISVTVLIAPPVDEYGIHPAWGGGTSVPAPAPAPATADGHRAPEERGGPMTAEHAPAGPDPAAPPPTRRRRAPRQAAPADAPRAAAQAAAQPLPMSLPEETSGPHPGSLLAMPGGSADVALAAPDIGTTRGAAGPRRRQSASAVPQAAHGGTSLPEEASGKPPVRATDAGVSVDETALVRGFVERFERLLAESEEQRKQRQQAEDRGATLERQLRAAEKRAESAESKLAAAQERIRTWTELTRRMQQLSRQADGRTKAKQPKSGA